MQVPTATYRIQFHANFKFADAEELIPYLHDLGVSHLYSSPTARARRGSQHGYDVADPLHISAELGTEQEVKRLVQQLRQHGMGLLLDVVPNHMAASAENPWWMDVLENGRESAYAPFFDIDWEAPGSKSPAVQKNHIVLPILTDLYDRVLRNQQHRLRIDEKSFCIQAEGTRLPINPETYAPILETAIGILPARLPTMNPPSAKSNAFSRKCARSHREQLVRDLRSSATSCRCTPPSHGFERLSMRQ